MSKHIWHEYKNILPHDRLGFIDGLAFVLNIVNQSCDYPYNHDSIYAHEFDNAHNKFWEMMEFDPEFVRKLYRDLCNQCEIDYQKIIKSKTG